MTEIQNDLDSVGDVTMMKEAIAKLALRVETLEKQAVSEASIGTNGDGTQDFRPFLIKVLARMKEIHAALVTGLSSVEEELKKLKASEETIAKQGYQIKHLKRSLEAEERKNA